MIIRVVQAQNLRGSLSRRLGGGSKASQKFADFFLEIDFQNFMCVHFGKNLMGVTGSRTQRRGGHTL